MWPISLWVAAFVVVSFTHWVYRWRNPKCSSNLPPGSMGWPLLGETLQFFTPDRSDDIPTFVKRRMERYGSIFKTSLLGNKVIASTDSDLNSLVFTKEDQLFQSWYPASMTAVFGKKNVSTLYGYLHKFVKNMVLNQFGPESLKKMLSEIECVSKTHIERWAHKGTVDLKVATADMIFDFSAKKLISHDLEKSFENTRENFDTFITGLISIPIAIPGTAHYKCLQGRKKVMRMLKKMLEERRRNPNANKDFFNYVIEELKREDTFLTDAIALDLMFLLLFASYETTSITTTVAIKLLMENPRALKELTEEQEKIVKERANPDSGLTWEEYKSMTFMFQVINESVRLANLVPVLFRKIITDFEYKGYSIPAGWVIMICPPATHLNPDTYKDPFDFNPWRWEGMGFKGASKDFMAFGGGQRFCVGADFARLEIAVTLHNLVTKYRWKLVKGGEIIRTPGIQFPNGFHVHISKKNEDNKSATSQFL